MINFRAIEQSDLRNIKELRNSKDVHDYCREYRLLSDIDQDSWFESYQKRRRTSDWDEELMIIEDLKHEIVGVCGFTRIQWRNQRAELSFYCTRDDLRAFALKKLIDLAFLVYGFNKITWPVYSHDLHLFMYKELMNEEAVLKEEYLWNGEFQSRHYLSLLKGEFFFKRRKEFENFPNFVDKTSNSSYNI